MCLFTVKINYHPPSGYTNNYKYNYAFQYCITQNPVVYAHVHAPLVRQCMEMVVHVRISYTILLPIVCLCIKSKFSHAMFVICKICRTALI